MTRKQTQETPIEIQQEKLNTNHVLVLYNDDVNTFEYVIDCLIDICGHDELQAEQCAFLTHYKGKCEIKNGKYCTLKPMKDSLTDRGLSVTIE